MSEIKAKIAESNAILLEPSPQLTDEENIKYLKLLNQRFTVDAVGEIIVEKKVSDQDNQELKELVLKAYPEEKNEER